MDANKSGGFQLIGFAFALGVLGDMLFRNAAWGLNVTLWLLAVFAAAVWMRPSHGYPLLSRYVWVAVALSVLAVFRDAFTLRLITLIALLAAVAFSTLSNEQGERLKQTVFTFLGRMADTMIASITVFTQYRWPLIPAAPADLPIPSLTIVRALRSAVLSAVSLLLFGSLLVSADVVFERIVVDLFDLDFATAFSHSGLTLLYAWFGCTLVFVLTVGPPTILSALPSKSRTAGYAIEINCMLTTINALFMAFLVVQAGYFFGGHDRILEEVGLTYAENARRGFFEIATVAVSAFVMVLVCDAFIPLAASPGRRGFNALVSLHVGLVGALIASASHRLMLYVDAYGLTELRFYVATAILWIALAFVLLAYAILRPNRPALPRMLVNTLFAAVFLLHAINPAAIVARTNITRDNAPERFDMRYTLSMGADAVPALLSRRSLLTREQRLELEAELQRRWGSREAEFRDWNFSRWMAARVVRRMGG